MTSLGKWSMFAGSASALALAMVVAGSSTDSHRGRRARYHTTEREQAAFVTTLGRDTVALESFTRTSLRIDGAIVVRIPGTVLCRYSVEWQPDHSMTHAQLQMQPLGTAAVAPRTVTMEAIGDSLRTTIDGPAGRQRTVRPRDEDEFPLFMTGFGSSFGLYSSLGLYEQLLSMRPTIPGDTMTVRATGLGDGRLTRRRFIRRSPGVVDADYFGIEWTHLTLDTAGRIRRADASATTEKTHSERVSFFDVAPAAEAFATADGTGTGMGVASPDRTIRATVGEHVVSVSYGSPRKRGRVILGNVVAYDRIWRTGANEATTLTTDHDLAIGGASVPAGSYSLWTRPRRDGVVELIINRQHGQWGTDYDPRQDLVRVPLSVAVLERAREDFQIAIVPGGTHSELRISWDTFAWSTSLASP